MLLVLDTARADAFEPYGAPAGASPNVATMARDGGHVSRAYAPGSWTVPSHVSMLTGQWSRAVGLGKAPDGTLRSTRPRMERLHDVLLPEVFRRAGYRTAAASCNAWISPTGGWDLGFDSFEFVPSPRGHPGRRVGRTMARWLWRSALADIDDGARDTETAIRGWFARWDGRDPFFWLVNVVECHSPYLPPRPYNDLGPTERLRAIADADRHQTFDAMLRANLDAHEVPAASLRRMRHLYGRAIRLLDDWVGRLLDLLERHGVLDDTIVVVTSDHGENFGEGGRLGHMLSLDERLIHIPFVARGPVTLPQDSPWSTIGLPALLSDAAGLDGPYEPFEAGDPAPAQFDPPADRDHELVRRMIAELDLDEAAIRRLTEPQTCVVAGDHKLLQHGDAQALVDLATDPEEVVAHPPERADARLHAALAADALWARLDDDDPATVPDERPPDERPPDEETARLEEQMRLLGYL